LALWGPSLTDPIPTYVPRLPNRTAARSLTQQLLESWWPNAVSFLLTLLSTTLFGAALVQSFAQGRTLDEFSLAQSYLWLLHGDGRLWTGLVYSAPLLLILLAHEFGHYFSCRWWRVRATLPYFGPSPTLFGTIGAFIWIRAPIFNRRSLFDIGVSGPICGFLLLLPFLWLGVSQSHVCPAGPDHGLLSFGTPLILALMERVQFPGVPAAFLCLHPTAVAAWAGLLATAINLLPIGQLDGGHILYALFGERWHTLVSRAILVLLAVFGLFYHAWWIWVVVLFIFRRHPYIYDEQPLNASRRAFGALALVILVLSFVVIPIRLA
jgi:membrane-associated protease RseP (regulator of RpoE activity)